MTSTAHPHALAQRLLGGLADAKTATWECASHSVAWNSGTATNLPPHLTHFTTVTVASAFGPVRTTNGIPEGLNTLDPRASDCAHAAASLSAGMVGIARIIREHLGADQIILTGRWSRKAAAPTEVPEPFDMETAGDAARRAAGMPTDLPITVRVKFRRLRGGMRPIVEGLSQPGNADLGRSFNDLLCDAIAPWATRHAAWIASFSSVEIVWQGIPRSRHAAMRAAAAAASMTLPAVPASTAARFERFLLDVERSLGALRLGLRRDAAGRIGLCVTGGKERTPLDRSSGKIELPLIDAPFIVPADILPVPCRPMTRLADRMRDPLDRVAAATGHRASIRIQRALHTDDHPVTTMLLRSDRHRTTLTQRGRDATWHATALTIPFDVAEGVAEAMDGFFSEARANGRLDVTRLDARYSSADASRSAGIERLPGVPEDLLAHLGVAHCSGSATVRIEIARDRDDAFRFRINVHRSGTRTTDAILAGFLRALWRRWIGENTATLAGIGRIAVAMNLSATVDQRPGPSGEPLRAAVAHALLNEAMERHHVAFATGSDEGVRLVPADGRTPAHPGVSGAIAARSIAEASSA